MRSAVRCERRLQRVTAVRERFQHLARDTNLIEIKPTIVPQDVKRRIEETLLREASLDAKNIQVEVNGGEITLRGNVRSFLERHEAEKAAWSAPGVTLVHNLITIEPAYAA